MSEKKYLNGLIIKARTNNFQEEELRVSVKVEDLVKELQDNSKNGWCNLIIVKRKEASPKGVTHSTLVDTWEPGQSATSSPATPNQYQQEADSDLPF